MTYDREIELLKERERMIVKLKECLIDLEDCRLGVMKTEDLTRVIAELETFLSGIDF